MLVVRVLPDLTWLDPIASYCGFCIADACSIFALDRHNVVWANIFAARATLGNQTKKFLILLISQLPEKHQDVIEAGLRAHMSEGGFYLLVDFSLYREQFSGIGITADLHVCAKILVHSGFALLPGRSFSLPPKELAARLAYVGFDGKSVLRNISQQPCPAELSTKYAAKMSRGIKKLKLYLGEFATSRLSIKRMLASIQVLCRSLWMF